MALAEELVVADQQVFHDPEHPSRVVLWEPAAGAEG
jgi:hypothetical protein